MGKACTRTVERVAAAIGEINQADVRFEDLKDVKGRWCPFCPSCFTDERFAEILG